MAEPETTLDPAYGSADATPTPWIRARHEFAEAEVYRLGTVRPDHRPHIVPVLGVWHSGAWYFATGAEERKAHNLAANSRCAVSTGGNGLRGLDVTVEGIAARTSDETESHAVAEAFEAKYGHHLGTDGTFAGMGDAIRRQQVPLYRVTPTKAFAFGKGERFSQTRYRW